MIINHETIDLFGKPLLTWITIKTPMRTAVPLPSEACFVYILEAENQFLPEKEEIKVQAGQVILSLCGITAGRILSEHEQKDGQVSSIIIHFHKDLLLKIYENSPPPFWKELDGPVVNIFVQMAASELVEKYFEGVIHLFNNKVALSEGILILKLKEIILLLMQTKNSPQISQIMSSLFSKRTFSFKEVVDAHICSPCTIEQLAQLTNHSHSSFKREFKKNYNSTPGTYIIDKRAEKVADLLAISDESISSIGYQCGFSTSAHLSRIFKAKYGVTPSKYRLNFSDK